MALGSKVHQLLKCYLIFLRMPYQDIYIFFPWFEEENDEMAFCISPNIRCWVRKSLCFAVCHNKDSGKEQKAQQLLMTILPQSSPPECQAHYELGLAKSMVCVNYPYMDKCYSLLATYGAQEKRVRMILPLNVTEDGPIYVNAKQYHGIIRRRQSRAKAELGNKLTKVRKPYLHESRHLHAMRRARGCGGRFLNTKKEIGGKGRSKADRASHGQLSQAAVSSYSTGVQSDGRNPSSEKETPAGSCLSGSEVICMYSRGDLDNFQIEHPRQSTFQGVSNVIDRGKSIGFPAKWVAVADGLCNVLKVG